MDTQHFPDEFPAVRDDWTGATMIEVRPQERTGRGRWWRPNGQGYTDDVLRAGVYTAQAGLSRALGGHTSKAVSAALVLASVERRVAEFRSRFPDDICTLHGAPGPKADCDICMGRGVWAGTAPACMTAMMLAPLLRAVAPDTRILVLGVDGRPVAASAIATHVRDVGLAVVVVSESDADRLAGTGILARGKDS